MLDIEKTIEDLKTSILSSTNYDFRMARYIAYSVHCEMEAIKAIHDAQKHINETIKMLKSKPNV